MSPQAPIRMPARRLGHALAAAGFAALVTLVLAAPAAAHSRLVSTSPDGGSTIKTDPSAVRLLFDEAVSSHFATVVVMGPSGSRLDQGGPDVAGTTVAQPVRPLTAGGYLVAYRVVSVDGHTVSGEFRFRYAPAEPTTPSPNPAASPRQPAAGSTLPAAARRTDTAAGGGGHLLHYAGTVLAIVVTLAVVAVERVRARRRA